jgi:hypothetical protein
MSRLKKIRIKIFHVLNIDRAVFFAILARLSAMSCGLVTAYLISSYFSPKDQGFYYTFLSLLALQSFAELGLGIVIKSFASHEWVKLKFTREGRITGNANAKSKLISLARFAMKWYFLISLLTSVALSLGGLVFFGLTDSKYLSILLGPWLAICLVTAINLYVIPIWSLLEGCNQAANIYYYRFIQSIFTGFLAWAAIYLGLNLWMPSIVSLIVLMIGMFKIWSQYKVFIKDIIFGKSKGDSLDWQKDIMPLQWRISLTWLSGYFTFSFLVPILFYYQGPEIAGQMGMTWSFIMGLTSMGSSWVLPRSASFAMLVSQRKYSELDRRFRHLTSVVFGISLIGAISIFSLVYLLSAVQSPFSMRILPPLTTGYFLLATILISITLPVQMYFHAHKKEPLLSLYIVSGIISVITYAMLAKYQSVSDMAIGYLVITSIFCATVFFIWNKKRSEWHNLGK